MNPAQACMLYDRHGSTKEESIIRRKMLKLFVIICIVVGLAQAESPKDAVEGVKTNMETFRKSLDQRNPDYQSYDKLLTSIPKLGSPQQEQFTKELNILVDRHNIALMGKPLAKLQF